MVAWRYNDDDLDKFTNIFLCEEELNKNKESLLLKRH